MPLVFTSQRTANQRTTDELRELDRRIGRWANEIKTPSHFRHDSRSYRFDSGCDQCFNKYHYCSVSFRSIWHQSYHLQQSLRPTQNPIVCVSCACVCMRAFVCVCVHIIEISPHSVGTLAWNGFS